MSNAEFTLSADDVEIAMVEVMEAIHDDGSMTIGVSMPIYERMAVRGLIPTDPMEMAKLLRKAEQADRVRLNGKPSVRASWSDRRNFLMRSKP